MGRTIKIFLLLFVLSYSFLGITQNVFNQSFDVNNAPNLSSNALEIQNGYLFTQRADYNGFSHIQAFKTDTLGNFIDSNSIVQSSNALFYGYAGSLQKLSNGEYCQLYKIGPDSSLRLVFFDENLSIVRDKNIQLNLFSAPGIIKQINDSTIIMLGQVTNPASWDLVIINTDLQGNERWRSTFGTSGKDDYGYSIEYIDNKIVVGGQTYFTSQLAHTHIYKLNTNGILEFDTTYTNLNNGGFLTYHPNFGLFTSGVLNNTSKTHPFLASINPDLSINWTRNFFTNDTLINPAQMTINNNGIISMAGTKYTNNEFIGWFFQTNHNGDSLNSKIIDHILGNRAAFYDIRPTSDGGYIMAGETRAPSQDSWIVKVNSWGCDNIPCIVSVSEVPKNTFGSFQCYPNPSSGMGTIKGNLKNSNSSSSEIRIYNTIGQLVYSLPIHNNDFDFQVNLPNNGLYLIHLYQGNTMISSQKWVVQ